MKWIASLVGGAVIGVAAVLLHNVFVPVGTLIALVGSGAGILWIGKYFGKKKYKAFAGVGWLSIVIRAASPGIGGEILVEGNFVGNALIVGGILFLLIALFTRV